MAPSETRDRTLQELRRLRTAMMSAEWMLSLEAADEATRQAAARQLLRTQQAIVKLENAELAAIRDQLIANEAALAQGTADLRKALRKVAEVKQLLETAAAVLKIVGRVVALL